jgi:hypothetical protein
MYARGSRKINQVVPSPGRAPALHWDWLEIHRNQQTPCRRDGRYINSERCNSVSINQISQILLEIIRSPDVFSSESRCKVKEIILYIIIPQSGVTTYATLRY